MQLELLPLVLRNILKLHTMPCLIAGWCMELFWGEALLNSTCIESCYSKKRAIRMLAELKNCVSLRGTIVSRYCWLWLQHTSACSREQPRHESIHHQNKSSAGNFNLPFQKKQRKPYYRKKLHMPAQSIERSSWGIEEDRVYRVGLISKNGCQQDRSIKLMSTVL